MIGAIFAAGAIAHPPPAIHGDFDHDGRVDRAEVIRRPRGDWSLVVRRGARPRHAEVVYSMKEVRYFFIDHARPGRWRTACGKGYGPDQDHCTRKVVQLKGDTLDFGRQESSEAVALWTGKHFEVVWISD